MTTLKKLSLVFVCAIATATNCNNPLFDTLKERFPKAFKAETLLGTNLVFAGAIPTYIYTTSKIYTLPRKMFLKWPGVSIMAVGAGCVVNSFTEKRGWLQ